MTIQPGSEITTDLNCEPPNRPVVTSTLDCDDRVDAVTISSSLACDGPPAFWQATTWRQGRFFLLF